MTGGGRKGPQIVFETSFAKPYKLNSNRRSRYLTSSEVNLLIGLCFWIEDGEESIEDCRPRRRRSTAFLGLNIIRQRIESRLIKREEI